jgi:hypothetical protein
MTAELDWVLAQLKDVADSQPYDHELRRINRDESRILDKGVRSIQGELQKANYVGATHVSTTEEPMGSEYNLQREVVIGVRVTGLTSSKHGHVDPSGTDGVPFSDLVTECKDAILEERAFPDAGSSDTEYTHLEFTNEANTSHQWADFYRWDADVVLDGERYL